MSDSVRPHGLHPTRLLHPWDSPGKNTGVGCHFLPQCRKVKSESEVAQSCPTLSDPMDYRPPGSSIHGILQARVLEWGAIAFSKGRSEDLVKQTALLASPVCIGQARGTEKHIKRGAKGLGVSLSPACWSAPPLSCLCIFGSTRPHTSRMDFPAII